MVALYLLLAVQTASPSPADQLLAQAPKLAVMRDQAPDAFGRVVGAYQAALQKGQTADQAIGAAREIYVQDLTRRIANAPDQAILSALDSTIAVARELETKDPQRCAAYFGGGNAGDIRALLSPAVAANDDAAFARWFASASGPQTPPATSAEVQQFFSAAVAADAQAQGLSLDAYRQRVTSDPRAFCSEQRFLLERARQSPNAAALFRYRLQGPADPGGRR